MPSRSLHDVSRVDAVAVQRPADDPGARGGSVTGPALRHALYREFGDAEHLKAAWDELARRAGDLFGTYDWCRTWWRYYGRRRHLEIHALHLADRLVAVVPLFRETLPLGGLFLRTVRLVGSDHTLDAAGLVIEPAHAGAAVRAVMDALDGGGAWDLLYLGPLRSYMTVTEPISRAAAGHPGVQSVIHGTCDNWITLFDLPTDYERFLQRLPRMGCRSLQRRRRNLLRDHAVTVGIAETPEQIDRGIAALVRLHQQLWRGRGEGGVFGDWPAYAEFHRDVAQRLAREGRLSLITIEANDEVVGAIYGYTFGTRAHTLISGHSNEPAWRPYGIGWLLHDHSVQEAIGRGIRVIDDGRGYFEHKMRFGGRIEGERSVAILRRGWHRRLRFWAALRVAYLLHVGYCRVWFDHVAPRMGLHQPLRRFYIRSSFLAQLYRRIRFRLFGTTVLEHARQAARPAGRATPGGGMPAPD